MVKQNIWASKDSSNRIDKLTIKDRETTSLRYYYDAAGFLNQIDITGRKRLPLPSIIELVNRKWIDRIDTIRLINEIEQIDLVSLIAEISNITSVDLVDRITLIDAITNIGTLANLTNVGTVNLVNTISAITNIANLQSVDLIDRITLIDEITKIAGITDVANIANVQSVDLIDRITLIDDITTIGEVTVANVKTAGGTNIMLDKLNQGAYTERRSTLSNNGTATNWAAYTGNNRRGKFFSRGCRGFIYTIDVYCKDNAAAGGTITVYITPRIGMGPTYSATVTVPASGAAAWRSATFQKDWAYDSMLIFFVCSNADTQVGYDIATGDPDWWQSADAGATWLSAAGRLNIRVILEAETAGDIGHGIVNNIPIPNVGSELTAVAAVYTSAAEATIATISGAGECDYFICEVQATADAHETTFRLYADGVLALSIPFSTFNGVGIGPTTPGVTLTAYAVDGHCAAVSTLRVPFKRSLQIRIQNVLTNVNYWVYGKTNMIS